MSPEKKSSFGSIYDRVGGARASKLIRYKEELREKLAKSSYMMLFGK